VSDTPAGATGTPVEINATRLEFAQFVRVFGSSLWTARLKVARLQPSRRTL